MKNKNDQPIRTRQDLYDAIGDKLLEINVNAGITFGIITIVIFILLIVYKVFFLR